MTWGSAKVWCEQMGPKSNLVQIETEAESDYLIGKFGDAYSWIGATDSEEEGKFRWVDGSSVAFSNWNTGEPNNSNGNEDCVHIYGGHRNKWNDKNCAHRLPFICEKED